MDIVDYLKQRHNINFSEQQKEGVLCDSTSTLLLAVPGSGKTTVLVSRIANHIINYNISPKSILTLTYSKESARDMARRFNLLFSEVIKAPPKFCTIHSLCYSVMKRHAQQNGLTMPTLMSDNKGQKTIVMREIFKDLSSEYLTDDLVEQINDKISYVKNMMLTKMQITEIDKDIPHFSTVFFELERFKKEKNLYEYDDMLTYCYKLFLRKSDLLEYFSSKYKLINVDEAQDTSLIQYKIINMLVSTNSVFMVGDDDQSIYAFRGAYPQYLLNFASHYPNANVIKMEKNYRSNCDIVAVSNRFIKLNKQRYPKEMTCNNKIDKSINVIELSDYCKQYENIVQYISKLEIEKTLGIIYRNNDSAIPLINMFYKHNISYYMRSSKPTFFNSITVRDIIAYFRLARNQSNLEAFSQLYFKLGLSKGVYNFVKDNLHRYDDVFSTAIEISMLQDYKKEELNFYRYGFRKLATLPPARAIEYILESLGYKRFLESRVKDSSMKIQSYQRISTLVSIAEGMLTVNEFIDRLSYLDTAITEKKGIDVNSNITLSTIHSCKGLEFDEVILLDAIKDVIPTSDAAKDSVFGVIDLIESETRLFYVALTRAKSKLTIYTANKLNGGFAKPSFFVSNLFKEVVDSEIDETPDLLDTVVTHTIFGKGIVVEQNDDILCVDFEKNGKKSISYAVCRNADLIY